MATPTSAHDESARGQGLASILEVVRRRRLLALLPFVFVLAAAASMALFLPSLWTGKALILVNRQQIPEAFVRSTVNNDLEARLLTLSHEILTAPSLHKVIQEHDLYAALRRTRPPAEVLERMRKDIVIDVQDDRDRRGREPRSLAFTVSYTAADPVVAARVTNTLASLFTEANSRLREQQAAGTSEFLEVQLTEARQRLQKQEREIADYKERHLGELPEQRDVNLRTLERLQAQLQLAAENSRRANERRQMITQSLNDLDLASALTAGGTTTLAPSVAPAESAAARVNLLRQELAALQTRYSDKYPDVIQMKEQIRLLETRIAAEEKKLAAPAASPRPGGDLKGVRAARDLRLAAQNPYVLSLVQQLDQATVESKATAEEMTNLSRQLGVYQRRLENMPKHEQALARITRDYETTKQMFQQLLTKRSEADIASDLEQRQKGEHFRVIEPSPVPDRPVGPNRVRLLLVGLALALGAAGAAIVLAEQVDTSYRRAEEVRATIGVPVLSTIPRIVTEADRLRALRQRRLATAAVGAGLLLVIGTSFLVAHDNQSLVTLLTPDAAAAKR